MVVPPSSTHSWHDTVKRRVWATACALILWGLVIEARLVHLQVFRYDALVELAERQQLRSIETHPKRGEILDREGRVLAYSVDADTVVAFPTEVSDSPETTRQLCEVLACDDSLYNRIQNRLSQSSPFANMQRHISVGAAQRIRELGLSGIGLIKENRRFYPNKELAAHLIGYVGIDNQGLHGLESSYNEEISGQPGKLLVQTDALHRPLFSGVERPPTAGVTIQLTIDKYLQYIAERELRATVLEHGAAGGSVIIMQPDTGEILALANEPTFNPNAYALSSPDARRNRATQDVYEPGSTFKIVTASAAIEENVFQPDDIIDVSPGVIRYGSHRIEDVRNYGALSFADVIVKSSNVGASKIGVALGPERMGRYIRRFGFGQTLSEDFPGESRGIVNDPFTLTDSALASVSMGYNISVTPLQMAVAMSAVANGGELIAPRLVKALLSEDGRLDMTRRVVRRAIAPETAATLTRILEDVVTRGTARAAQLIGYTVAGKTGTAEKIVEGRYSETDHVASFVGFVPSNRPELTILVVVDDVVQFGGSVAAPTFQRIAEAALRHLGVPPNVDASPPVVVQPDFPPAPRARLTSAEEFTASGPIEFVHGVMPDLEGLSFRMALSIVTDLGLTTHVHGKGVVVSQMPEFGEAVTSGQAVTLQLARVGGTPVGSRVEP
jgi:cell division protein FtsI (penicillin-binding protein 3)